MSLRRKKHTSGFLVRLGLGLYRALVVVSAIIVAVYLGYRFLVPPPSVPAPDYPDSSQVGNFAPEQQGLKRREQVWTFLLMGTDDGNGNITKSFANGKVGFCHAADDMPSLNYPDL